MDNKKLSRILKAAIIFLAVLGAGVFAVLIPFMFFELAAQYPEFGGFVVPWLVFLSVAAVPLYLILVLGLIVSGEIGRDRSFSRRNVTCLKGAAVSLLAEAAYFFMGNVVLWLLNLNYPLIVILSLALSLFAVSIAAAVFVLSHLLEKAVEMREENEAII